MGKSLSDEKILSYNDVVLRRSDLDILSGPFFLNDRVIEFYFSYLSTIHQSHEILLVPPSIAFWITNCPDPENLKDFLAPLNLPGRKVVIFPVNNNDDVSVAEGGSHWSLLAYERSANVFIHHDSNGGMNKRHAMQLYNTVAIYMGDPSSASNSKYVECASSPQQVNGYDCGVYVTAIAKVICNWYKTKEFTDGLWISVAEEQVNPSAVSQMRREILEMIKGLMAKK